MKTLLAAAASILFTTMAFAVGPGTFRAFSSLALLDGRALRAGHLETENGYMVAVQRVLPNGLPDPTFGSDGTGVAKIPFWGFYESAAILVLQPDGRILVAGSATDSLLGDIPGNRCHASGCLYYPVIGRLEPDGLLDMSFNGSGKIALAIGDTNEDPNSGVQEGGTLTGIALHPDGRIDVFADRAAVVARLLRDGTLDPTFGRDAVLVPREVVFARHQGLWYQPGVDGWSLAISQQGETLFGIWFLADETGSPSWGSWLAWVATKIGPNAYDGRLHETRGPGFNVVPFDPSRVSSRDVGSATLAVDATGTGVFSYALGSRRGTKAMKMASDRPTCTSGAQRNLSLGTNFDGHWWAAPAGSEAGWGLHLTHRGDDLHAAWMTYDAAGAPVWFAAMMRRRANGGFEGQLLQQMVSGGSGAVPGDFQAVGSVALSFRHGNTGTFLYTLDGAPQTKAITRFVFAGHGTICSR